MTTITSTNAFESLEIRTYDGVRRSLLKDYEDIALSKQGNLEKHLGHQ